MTKSWLYGFQATHIQQWILRSTRLRHIQGASNLLERLCKEHFAAALEAVGGGAAISQNAGSARVLFGSEEAAKALMMAWPLICDRAAPGLVVQQALVAVSDDAALGKAQQELGARLYASRNAPVVALPVATPPMRRNPRTGLPAVEVRRGKGGKGGEEVLDREILARQREWEEQKGAQRRGGSDLDARFLGPLADEFVFETGAEDDVGPLASGYVAVIHADGNDVGKLAQAAASQPGHDSFRKFSEGLADATEKAAQKAVARLREGARRGTERLPVLPGRPILLGGDDMTAIVAARHAFDFATTYLESFEQLAKDPGGKPITACCGMALVKANFPYDRAHVLAESLCQQAKRKARDCSGEGRTPCALAFHRVTTSLPGDARTVVMNELTGRSGVRLTLEAYGVGKAASECKLPMFTNLQQLAGTISRLPRTQIRELATLLHEGTAAAELAWHRFREVNKQVRPAELKALNEALVGLGVDPEKSFVRPGDPPATPLLEALRLEESKPKVERADRTQGGEA